MFTVKTLPDPTYAHSNAIFIKNPLSNYVKHTASGLIFFVKNHHSVFENEVRLNLFQRKALGVNPEDKIELEFLENNPPCLAVADLYLTNSVSTIVVIDDEKIFLQEFLKKFNEVYVNKDVEYVYKNFYVKFNAFGRIDTRVSPRLRIKTADHCILTSRKTSINLGGSGCIDFKSLGIGGLDAEAEELFTKAFSSRLLKNETVERLGISHVKGILLYGPPGTGKTLIARKLAELLGNDVVTKIVNGPELLNKFVGESEKNVRELFEPAIKNPNKMHVIIFDEIDSLCKKRGSGGAGGTGVGDNIVNQILTKLDGVDSPKNILVIGMTNRKDRLDEAILRSGRMEVHLEIKLPDEQGRKDILEIHTRKLREEKFFEHQSKHSSEHQGLFTRIAKISENYSGADLESLVRNAVTLAIRDSMVDGVVQDDNIVLKEEHFLSLLKPKIIEEGKPTSILENLKLGTVSLLSGPRKSGKVLSVNNTAKSLGSTIVKIISNRDFIELDDSSKALALVKEFMSLESIPNATMVFRNVEDILGVSPSPFLINTINTIFREKSRTLTIVLTTSGEETSGTRFLVNRGININLVDEFL